MNMLESIERLRRCRWSEVEKVAKGSGIPFNTLIKIARGETVNPRMTTAHALQEYFAENPDACASEQEAA